MIKKEPVTLDSLQGSMERMQESINGLGVRMDKLETKVDMVYDELVDLRGHVSESVQGLADHIDKKIEKEIRVSRLGVRS